MSALNPYHGFLDGRPVEVILAATPAALSQALAVITPQRASDPPAPGKWSPAQILCHLADCELVFAFRLRQTLAENHPPFSPSTRTNGPRPTREFPPLMPSPPSPPSAPGTCGSSSLHCPPPRTPVTHPERGAMTFQTIVETMAGHDLNHLAQLKRIAGQSSPASASRLRSPSPTAGVGPTAGGRRQLAPPQVAGGYATTCSFIA